MLTIGQFFTDTEPEQSTALGQSSLKAVSNYFIHFDVV